MKRKATLIRIFGYLLQHKRQLAFILSLSFLGNLLALAQAVRRCHQPHRRGHGREHGSAWSL